MIEFPDCLKLKGKTMNVTLRDESDENGSFMAFTVLIGSESTHGGSSEEELDEDDYRELTNLQQALYSSLFSTCREPKHNFVAPTASLQAFYMF